MIGFIMFLVGVWLFFELLPLGIVLLSFLVAYLGRDK